MYYAGGPTKPREFIKILPEILTQYDIGATSFATLASTQQMLLVSKLKFQEKLTAATNLMNPHQALN